MRECAHVCVCVCVCVCSRMFVQLSVFVCLNVYVYAYMYACSGAMCVQINKKIDNLGVVRLMRCNVFCFMLNGKLYLSTAELEQRSLMPPGYHLVTNNLFLFSMEEKKDVSNNENVNTFLTK